MLEREMIKSTAAYLMPQVNDHTAKEVKDMKKALQETLIQISEIQVSAIKKSKPIINIKSDAKFEA